MAVFLSFNVYKDLRVLAKEMLLSTYDFIIINEGGKYSAEKRSYIQKRRIAGSYVQF